MSTHLKQGQKSKTAAQVFAERVAKNDNVQSYDHMRNYRLYNDLAWDHRKKKKMFRVPGTNRRLLLIAGSKKSI